MRTLAKIITATIIASTSLQAVAAQFDVYVRFKDGTSHRYLNRTDSPNALQHLALDIQRDFPSKPLTDLATVDSFPAGTIPPAEISQQKQVVAVTPVSYQPAEVKEEAFCSSTGCKVVVGAVALAALYYGIKALPSGSARAFPCMLPTDRAKDGSLCGGRASSVRPGGR
jgi:hypothetical protein